MIAQIRNLLQFFGIIDREDDPVQCSNPDCRSLRWRSHTIYTRGAYFCNQECAENEQIHNGY